VTSAVVGMGIAACLVSLTAVAHAATPLTLPFGDLGLQATPEIALPLPPPPRQVARPDVTRMRQAIKPLPRRGCGSETRRNAAAPRHTTTLEAAAGTKRFRLG
jgi:hypothetical protein